MRILSLEDDPTAAELIQATLEEHGLNFEMQRVESRQGFIKAIQDGRFDVILADYSLPSFSGTEALELAREECPGTPFIFVSGALGEELAVETLKNGATDYLLKGRLVRLGPAIERALRERSESRARTEALARLQVSEERFRLLVESSNDLVVEISLDGTCHYASPNHLELLGHDPARLVNRNILQLIHPDDVGMLVEAMTLERATRICRVRDGKGRWLWFECSGRRFSTSGGEEHAVVVSRNITPRIETERQLRQQARMLDLASDAIVVCDTEETIRYWNPSAERLYGRPAEEVLHKRFSELVAIAPGAFKEARRTLKSQGHWQGELQLRDPQGTVRVVNLRMNLVLEEESGLNSILIAGTDMTEKQELESQYLRAQRMEGIGLLASGIAHDLNNILAPILMSAPLLRMEPMSRENQELLGNVEKSAQRGAELVKQILSFARGMDGNRTIIQLRHLLNEIVRLISNTFSRSIVMKTEIPRGLWTVSGETTHLHQMFLNICINARDSMEGGGTLEITARNIDFRSTAKPAGLELSAAEYVLVRIADTGTGIPPELHEKVFEPFFTTKESGQGTGLGLASVKNIVKSHHGVIRLDSEPGRGTVFDIYLPSAEQHAEVEDASTQPSPPRGNGECILVVDDESRIRDVTRRVLEQYGYQVESAADGVEAIGAFTRRKDSVRVLLTDADMPKLDGKGLIRALLGMRPELKVAVCGGRLSEEERKAFSELGVTEFLQKPYDSEGLLHSLHRMLQS